MELLCPTCQRRLTIPDQYAGQPMKCPLCNNTFTAPALAPVPAPATAPPPPPPPAPPGLASGGGPAVVTPTQGDGDLAPVMSVTPPAPPPVVGDYTHRWSIRLSPRVLPWVTLGLFGLVFLLTFFPWVWILVTPPPMRQDAWDAAFGSRVAFGVTAQGSAPLIVYILLLILVLLLAIAAAVLPLLAASLPPALRTFLPWRWGVVAAVALLTFLFLILQLLVGFKVEQETAFTYRTDFLTLAVVLHVVAILLALLVFRADMRQTRPVPRIDIVW
jgi:hypothetical protein